MHIPIFSTTSPNVTLNTVTFPVQVSHVIKIVNTWINSLCWALFLIFFMYIVSQQVYDTSVIFILILLMTVT